MPSHVCGKIYEDITQCIGTRPLIRLRRVVGDAKATVVAKMESFNPLWSSKDLNWRGQIDAGERDGRSTRLPRSSSRPAATRASAWRSLVPPALQADRHHGPRP